MAARDVFHAAVRQALMTDGWTITHDPLFVAFGGVDLYIDLGAEKLIGAERDGRQIAVEVKSFLGPSLVSDFTCRTWSIFELSPGTRGAPSDPCPLSSGAGRCP